MKLRGKKLFGIGIISILLVTLALVAFTQKGPDGTTEKVSVVQENDRKEKELQEETKDFTAGEEDSEKENQDEVESVADEMEDEKKREEMTEEPEAAESAPESKAEIVSRAEAQAYTPISDGWKVSKSVKGDITSEQKSAIDTMVEKWKNGGCTDEGLKAELENYLIQQGVKYVEVSVTSQGYSLTDKIPEVQLENGGNLYSFMGIYSTGEQNPQGTGKTVCYHWSVFIF